MSYDHYLTTEPEPSEEWAECDCCGILKPWQQMSICTAYGIEMWACSECLDIEEEEEDGQPLTEAELQERTREMLAPCTDLALRQGCTCSMEPVPHWDNWADGPPEPVVNRSCPLHGSPAPEYEDRIPF